MEPLTYRRLSPAESADVAVFQRVFRGTPSYTYATAGRVPADAEVEAMMRTLPGGRDVKDIFVYAISTGDALCGCAFTVRGYPKHESACLVRVVQRSHHV